MKKLIGRKINSISVSGDESVLSFNTDQGEVNFEAYGDCCSQSWFADITGVSALIGGTVSDASEVSMDGYNVDDGRCKQEIDSAYGWKISTDKGYADIVFRNSSNGYYGGSLEDGPKVAPKDMRTITDDWRA